MSDASREREHARPRRPAASSSATATSPPSTAPTSSSTPARSSRSSATTAPASRADQGAVRRRHPRRGRDPPRRAARSTSQSPIDARKAGIETVYQDLAVAPALDIADNLFLGREQRRTGPLGSVLRMLDKGGMKDQAAQHMRDLQIGIRSMSQAVETLSGGQRQGVAVARTRGVGAHARDHGRADRRARRQGVQPGARPDPARARPRAPGHPHQPQHAARVRDRRPHPRPPPRQARGRGRPQGPTPCTRSWAS